MDDASSVSSSSSPGAASGGTAKPEGGTGSAVGWPPLAAGRRGVRKRERSLSDAESSKKFHEEGTRRVKVEIDGHALVKKVLLHDDATYEELASAIEGLFADSGSEKLKLSECEMRYQTMEGEWLVVGETKWELFYASAKRIRITET